MRLLFIAGIIIAVIVYHFFPLSAGSKNSASHVIAAINFHNKAALIVNKPGLIISAADHMTMQDFNKQALAEAEQADITEMNRYYPGFGDHFRDEFIQG